MQNLKAYVESMNKWNSLFGNYRKLDLKSAADRKAIASDIDMKLSPENISCDGELPARQVMARRAALHKVAAELLALDPSVEIHEYY
jgi:hypothetical protein